MTDKNKKKCEWFVDKNMKNCTKNTLDNNKYCAKHDYVNGYTEDEIKKKRHCSSCRKVKYFPETQGTCGCASERVAKLNEERKLNNQPNVIKKEEEKEKKESEKQKLVLDHGYKICEKCNEAREPNSFVGEKDITMHCKVCRDKQKERDAKRTRTRDWSEEYKNNPELYQKKLEYNKNNPNQSEYQKKYRENLKK